MRSFLICTANELRKLFWRPTVYILIGVVAAFTILSMGSMKALDFITRSFGSWQQSEVPQCLEEASLLADRINHDYYPQLEPAQRAGAAALLQHFMADLTVYSQDVPDDSTDWRCEAFLTFYNRFCALFDEYGYFGYSFGNLAPMAALRPEKEMDSAMNIPLTTALLADYEAEYAAIHACIETDDWRQYIQLYEEIARHWAGQGQSDYLPAVQDKVLAILTEIVDLRLDYDIKPEPSVFGSNFGNNWRNDQLSEYRENREQLILQNGMTTQEREAYRAACDRILSNLQNNTPPIKSSMMAMQFSNFQGLLWVVCVMMAVIAGGIASREYQTGTVKLLLTQPHRRHNIFLGKVTALLVTGLSMVAVMMVLGTLMFGLCEGFKSLGSVVHYTFNGQARSLPLIGYMAQGMLLALPNLLICMLLAMMLSVLLRSNAWSIVLSLLYWFGSSLLSTILLLLNSFFHITWLRFLPFLNGNWSIFRTDELSEMTDMLGVSLLMPGQRFGLSVGVTAVTVALLFYIAYDSFTRRDIK